MLSPWARAPCRLTRARSPALSPSLSHPARCAATTRWAATTPSRLATPTSLLPRHISRPHPRQHHPHQPATSTTTITPTSTRASSSAASSRWKQRQGSDPFARSARVRGLKSRAAFKLLELDAKYHLFRRGKGQVVVDLGYAPGSWSQVALDRTAPDGTVVGIDVIPAQPPKGVSTIQGNFLSPGVRGMVKQFLVEGERKRAAERARRRKEGREELLQEGEGTGLAGEGGGESEAVVADRPSYIDLERMAAHESEAESAPKEAATKKENLQLVDVVLSDMSAPWPQTHGFSVNSLSNPYARMMNTSGIAFKDHAGSMVL
ncbi:FtsJ-like methyltransferase-domain-containing protein, partial [Staphylotrichum tortipilum]